MNPIYAPDVNQFDDIMRPIDPSQALVSETRIDTAPGPEGYQPMYQSWALNGAGVDTGRDPEGYQPMYQSWALNGLSPLIANDVGTPTVDMLQASGQFAAPALNGGLGAVADALSVLSVMDMLTR